MPYVCFQRVMHGVVFLSHAADELLKGAGYRRSFGM